MSELTAAERQLVEQVKEWFTCTEMEALAWFRLVFSKVFGWRFMKIRGT